MFAVQNHLAKNLDFRSTDIASEWHDVWTIGNLNILQGERIAVFCSSRCPGDVILRAFDLARSLRNRDLVLVGGFHSPMEKEILHLLLRGSCRVVVCPSRAMHRFRLSNEFRTAVEANKLLLVSPFAESIHSGSSATAEERNQFVAALAARILVVHASTGGKIEALAIKLLGAEKPVILLGDSNEELCKRGGILIDNFMTTAK